MNYNMVVFNLKLILYKKLIILLIKMLKKNMECFVECKVILWNIVLYFENLSLEWFYNFIVRIFVI